MTEPFAWPIRVYYEDTDAQGVVYYANYFRFMERARTEWLRALGVDQVALMQNERRIFVVTETNAEFSFWCRRGSTTRSLSPRGYQACLAPPLISNRIFTATVLTARCCSRDPFAPLTWMPIRCGRSACRHRFLRKPSNDRRYVRHRPVMGSQPARSARDDPFDPGVAGVVEHHLYETQAHSPHQSGLR